MTEHAPLIIDIAGLRLTDTDRQRLSHPRVGGLILFRRNWQDREQLTQLTVDIKQLRPDLLICVDHEGGRVQRFRTDGFTHLPPMRELGARWVQDPIAGQAMATAAGFVLASELRACGVDFSFTPVLDLDHGRSDVIGDRAFHRQPKVVAAVAQALMQGLSLAGMSSCGKHFPGHGYAEADSHVAVPVDRRALATILADDARPYGGLSLALGSVMPAHVIYPKVDPLPAGFSSRWLQEILRGQLGFQGAIFSDDLSMEGARHLNGQSLSYAQAAVMALQAGCDLALLCNRSPVDGGRELDELIEGLDQAEATGAWQPDETSEARRLALLPTTEPLNWDTLVRDGRYHAALERLP